MNEKIKELAEQAGLYKLRMSDELVLSETEDQVMEKFAELIVLKCAEIADTAEPFLSSDLIKQHFGVDQ